VEVTDELNARMKAVFGDRRLVEIDALSTVEGPRPAQRRGRDRFALSFSVAPGPG
jgi:hypothetical protein